MLCRVEVKSTDADTIIFVDDKETDSDYNESILQIVGEINAADAPIILDYLFQDKGKVSLSEMEEKYKIPRSTIHYKMEAFRLSIGRHFRPESEEDGIKFLKKLASTLDEIVNAQYNDSEQ